MTSRKEIADDHYQSAMDEKSKRDPYDEMSFSTSYDGLQSRQEARGFRTCTELFIGDCPQILIGNGAPCFDRIIDFRQRLYEFGRVLKSPLRIFLKKHLE